jgi:hypothetical protein
MALIDFETGEPVDSAQLANVSIIAAGTLPGNETIALAFQSEKAVAAWAQGLDAEVADHFKRLERHRSDVSRLNDQELEGIGRAAVQRADTYQSVVERLAAQVGSDKVTAELMRKIYEEPELRAQLPQDPTMLWDQRNESGRSRTLWSDLPDFRIFGFDKQAISASAIAGVGTLYDGYGWQGARFHMFGFPFASFELDDLGWGRRASSYFAAWAV